MEIKDKMVWDPDPKWEEEQKKLVQKGRERCFKKHGKWPEEDGVSIAVDNK